MPELPDVTVYIDCLKPRILGREIRGARVLNPFVLRTVAPPLSATVGQPVRSVTRLGKRIVLGTDGELYIVVHLMIAGRLRWRDDGKKIGGKLAQASFDFDTGTLYLTEAGSKRRASIHVVEGAESLAQFDRGGLEVLDADVTDFAARLRAENHTLKRSLTDPRLFSGIGNAYSDEILHRARLSPLMLTSRLTDEQIEALFTATKSTLIDWTNRLRAEVGDGFPEKVTAFRDGMAVHGRYNLPCPVCGAPVQRIRYADNETNYCARCQTGGRLLADRAMSRLLKQDWPRSIDELE
ncbi:MAG TPA: DNA-formamidopyrimidine glycosylase family protein [Gemmatimonadaceae bacterium]|jgi:formamidopyrimidine-DNA glycosylase|nr:DNA-formamidopyrimidine glycosylase family protein [Gemmatimonadaceae bacterium]